MALVYQLKQSNILVTVGDDEETISPTVKVWNWDKAQNGAPSCSRVWKAVSPGGAVPASALAVAEVVSSAGGSTVGTVGAVAVGLCNGAVLLFRPDGADILRTRHVRPVYLAAAQEGVNPVTALAFGPSPSLFVVTSATVFTYDLSSKDYHLVNFQDSFDPQQELDDKNGCGVGCGVLSDDQEMVVGRKEAVYFYEPESRGRCFVFEGEKKLLSWFRSYLIIVGQDPNNLKFNSFTIYDLNNKFIAYMENRFQNITHVVSEWGSIFVLTGDGKIYQLEEKDTQTKLETLFKKNLYLVAINLALSQNYDPTSITDIFRRYGDHLYE